MDKYDLLIDAYKPGLPPMVKVKQRTICAMTGEALEYGYRLPKVIDKKTTGQAELFRFGGQMLGERAARLMKASKLLRGNLLAMPGKGLRPLISISSASEERPAWRDIVRKLKSGTPTIAIISGEFQRRLWHLAPLSYFGGSWRPFCNFDDECRPLNINVIKLRECLDLVEQVYADGFSKSAIKSGLMGGSAIKVIKVVGFGKTKEYETWLNNWRKTDEFKLAVFIAQKEENTDVRTT